MRRSLLKDGNCVFGCAIFYKGAIVYARSPKGGTCAFSKEVEAQKVLFALNKAKELQLDQILILKDSLEVFSAIKGNEDWVIRSFVMKILDLSKCFVSLEFRHFSRVLNVAIHFMAKFCLKFGLESIFFTVFQTG